MASHAVTGDWRVAPASDDNRRSAPGHDFDASAWHEAPVPGHWQRVPALANHDDPVLYRLEFSTADISLDARSWLVFDSVGYGADVWFDGAYLGTTQGYFAPHEFEVTSHLADRDDHVLAVEVFCSRSSPTSARRNLLGIYDNAEFMGQTTNPGGIWQPVRLVTSGSAHLQKLRVLCTEATEENASIRFSAQLTSVDPQPIDIVTSVLPPDGGAPVTVRTQHHLASGDTSVEWRVGIDNPQLWWPRSLGDQPLYRAQVAVVTEDGGTSDLLERTIGLRTVELRGYQLTVNQRRMFVKGANVWPASPFPAEAPQHRSRDDIDHAVDLNLDLLRVHTHVANPDLYEAADRAGVLLWQDLPLDGPVARGLRSEAVGQAEAMVDLLAHHPSIVLWCAHNDPTGTSRHADRASTTVGRARRVGLQQVPSWNKSVLDRWVERAIRGLDPTRHVIPHSGTWPSPPRLDGTDSHLWFGWGQGFGRDLARLAKSMPRMVRWVSAFGTQSVPMNADFCEAGRWPSLNWSNLAGEFGLDRAAMNRYVNPQAYETFDGWAQATRNYQATVLRRQIETLRRLKYRPTGGFCFMALADGRPSISFAIIDHEGHQKAAYAAVQQACAPVIIVADRLPRFLDDVGEILDLDVHVVNDRLQPAGEHRTVATLRWPDGEQSWHWQGAVNGDCVDRVGRLTWTVPRAVGQVVLSIELCKVDTGEVVATNEYQSTIRTGSR